MTAGIPVYSCFELIQSLPHVTTFFCHFQHDVEQITNKYPQPCMLLTAKALFSGKLHQNVLINIHSQAAWLHHSSSSLIPCSLLETPPRRNAPRLPCPSITLIYATLHFPSFAPLHSSLVPHLYILLVISCSLHILITSPTTSLQFWFLNIIFSHRGNNFLYLLFL